MRTFNIIPYDDNNCGLITWTCKGGVDVQIGIFNLETAHRIKSDFLQLELVWMRNETSKREFKMTISFQRW